MPVSDDEGDQMALEAWHASNLRHRECAYRCFRCLQMDVDCVKSTIKPLLFVTVWPGPADVLLELLRQQIENSSGGDISFSLAMANFFKSSMKP